MLDVAIRHRLGAFDLEAGFTAAGGVTALFGRSGSGKTTLVNAIAGLLRPEAGRIVLGDVPVFDAERRLFVPKHRRRIGYVFQDARLFPHLSVRQNLSYGRWFAPRGADDGIGFDGVVEMLGIGHLLPRRPAGLSGGEKQRVAIGRALLSRPKLLLMDEPLAALDDARKAEILPFLERLRDATAVPVVYVSHSLAEVARLASRVVVMEAGRVVAEGTVADVLSRPGLGARAGRSEVGALLVATVLSHDAVHDHTTVESPAGRLIVPGLARRPGDAVRLHVPARDVMIATGPAPVGLSALNILPGTVAEIGVAEGGSAEVRIACGSGFLLARVTQFSAARLGLAPGLAVHAIVKSVALAD